MNEATRQKKSRNHEALHQIIGDRPPPWNCFYCQTPLVCVCAVPPATAPHYSFELPEGKSWATIDHIVPPSRGGTQDLGNLVAACPACNSSKSNRIWPDEWVPNINDATFVYRANVAPMVGKDRLADLGMIMLLYGLPDGRRYSLYELADIAQETVATLRTTLTRFARNNRIGWHLVRGQEHPYEHEFMDISVRRGTGVAA